MGAKNFAEFRIAVFFTGVKIQTAADLIGKSFGVILEDFRVSADLLFPFQVIYQGLPYDFISVWQRVDCFV